MRDRPKGTRDKGESGKEEEGKWEVGRKPDEGKPRKEGAGKPKVSWRWGLGLSGLLKSQSLLGQGGE